MPDPALKELSKPQLLERLMSADKKIVGFANNPTIISKQIKTPFGLSTATQFIQELVPH